MHSYDTTISGSSKCVFVISGIDELRASLDCTIETMMADLLVSQTGLNVHLVLNL